MPATRPDTAFIDGECSACTSFAKRRDIDWPAREQELLRILESAPKNDSGYTCIVPSSGGKDSHWQALKLIELGARPLVVTATTCQLTDIGRKNIDNLARYATTVEITPNRDVRAKLNKLGLELVGDISWPEHVSIFTTPFRAAADFGIPLIFYGECPQENFGGPIGTDTARTLTKRWRSEFGGFLGLRPSDMIGQEGITAADMQDYELPSDEKLEGVTAYFLGQFCLWDSHRNAKVAVNAGMTVPSHHSEISFANHWAAENLDNAQTGLHDHAMYRKFGYGRLCAQISVDIRSGLISRQAAKTFVGQWDGSFPEIYMEVPVEDVCRQIGVTYEWLLGTLDRFTNWDLFVPVNGELRPILKEFAGEQEAA